MSNNERIYVFGAKGCKYCKIQKSFLNKTFGDENWTYIDLKDDRKALEVADEIGLENIPSIVIFNSKFQEVARKEGTMPPDQIFKTLHSDGKIIPISKRLIPQIKTTKTDFVLLSYEPSFKEGDRILLSSYNDEKIGYAEVKGIVKVATDYVAKKYGNKIKMDYLNEGGKKDWAWMIDLSGFKEV